MLEFLKPKTIIKPFDVPEYIIFNVENFNNWFNAKDNNAVYAHSGIFLRTDKLDNSQIEDYILKCYGLDYKKYSFDKIYNFKEEIVKDWRIKLKHK